MKEINIEQPQVTLSNHDILNNNTTSLFEQQEKVFKIERVTKRVKRHDVSKAEDDSDWLWRDWQPKSNSKIVAQHCSKVSGSDKVQISTLNKRQSKEAGASSKSSTSVNASVYNNSSVYYDNSPFAR